MLSRMFIKKIFLIVFILTACGKKEYGVFLNSHKTALKNYEILVIDADLYSKEDIIKLKKNNDKVYSYLNIGSLENYRDYYDEFKDLTFADYENWNEERWIDVGATAWQDFVADVLAINLVNKGIDGFFIDNTDVYSIKHEDVIYQGLTAILKRLKAYDLPLIINGGDVYVYQAIAKNNVYFNGVNQEEIFSLIDFDNNSYLKQDKEVSVYFQEYVLYCKKNGLDVYIIEYGFKNDEMINFCKENNFKCYYAKSWELN